MMPLVAADLLHHVMTPSPCRIIAVQQRAEGLMPSARCVLQKLRFPVLAATALLGTAGYSPPLYNNRFGVPPYPLLITMFFVVQAIRFALIVDDAALP